MSRRRRRSNRDDPAPMDIDEGSREPKADTEKVQVDTLRAMTGTVGGAQLQFTRVQNRMHKKQEMKYRYHWTKKPGDFGFNKQVTQMMRERGLFVGDRLSTSCDAKGNRPFAHTITAAWLAGPETPIDRLLVIHRTGSGKTYAMIHILDRYFSDPRPKVVVFPNSEIVRNFYDKMKQTPSNYQAFVQARADAGRVANTMTYFKRTLSMDGELHKRGMMGELASPLRPISYSLAGGRQVFPRGGGKPGMPIFKIDWDGKNPFDNKIILMDEVHNLIRPAQGTDKQLVTRLERLRNALYSAKGSVIVGLTATPFVKNEEDGHKLLKMIKGKEYMDAKTNEGFISYFNTLPTTIYPQMLPEAMSLNITRIEMEGANLKKYNDKRRQRGALSKDKDKRTDQLFRLMGYCNMAGYYTQAGYADFKQHVRTDPVGYATKFDYIAKECMGHNKKCAVLIHRRLGFAGFKVLVEGLDPKNTNRWAFVGKPKTEKEKNDNPTLRAFNADDNSRGQKIRCLVLDAETYGEGIDLLGVRFFYMANPAPSYASYKQWEGRVLRACGYSKLNPSERNVAIEMFISRGENENEPTADMLMFDMMREETIRMEKAMMDIFGSVASDRIVLGLG